MIDHLHLVVSDYPAAVHFYTRALQSTGLVQLFSSDADHFTATAFGKEAPLFWIAPGARVSGPVHLAFRAQSREAVHRFYEDALDAGGRSNGGPGYRAQYYSGYYAAYVLDPDSNNIEVVFHDTALLGA